MLLSLQRVAGTAALCQKAFLCDRWVCGADPFLFVARYMYSHHEKNIFLQQKYHFVFLLCSTFPLPSTCPLVERGCSLCERNLMLGISTVPQHAIDHSLPVSFSVVVRAHKSREHLRNEVALSAFYSFHCLDMDLSAPCWKVQQGAQGRDCSA